MMTRGQYEALARLLPELYSAQTLSCFPRHSLDVVLRLIRAENSGFNVTNFDRRRFKVLLSSATEEQGLADVDATLTLLMQQHPMILHNRNTDQRALKMSQLLSQRQFHRLELYEAFYRAGRVEYLMTGGFYLSADGDIATWGFGRGGRDFGDGETALLNLLRPHLLQAYRNAEAMTTFQHQLENRERALESAADMAVMVVHKLTIKSAGPRVREWLARYFAGREGNRSDDQLPEPIARWLRFRKTPLNRKDSEARPLAPLNFQSPDGQLSIRLIETQGEQSMLLLTHDRGGDHPELLERLGLTRREAEVLLWISRGKTSRETATILSIAPKTVDKHVERIQRKLGAENRTVAAAIAWAALRNPGGGTGER
jgi:DNA-binding CsgD family transcriptional regulator